MATRPTMTMQAEVLDPDDDMMQAARSLGELQKADSNLTITQERNLFGDIVTARPMQVLRNEQRILKKIDILSAAAGTRFFYRYPVRNRRTKSVDYIEGASVKCTDAVLMLYMNAAVESRTVAIPGDKGGNYICYSRFCDWENGVSLTMGQLVPRSATLGGEDEERRQQIAHNVGQSKSRRNVVNAALGEYIHRAFMAAKNSLVERIGRDIAKSRQVIVKELEGLGVPDLVVRVEQVYGRKVGDWLAPDIARVYAEIQAVEDGMSSVDETWPREAPPEPRRDDAEDANVTTGAAAVSDRPVAEAGPAAAAAPQADAPPVSGDPSPSPTETSAPADSAAGGPAAAGSPTAPSSPPEQSQSSPDLSMPLEHWRVGDDVLGQENIIKQLDKLIGLAETRDDLAAIERLNAERLAKITGNRRATLNNALRAKRESLQGEQR
jgi:hypothetical protein